jgi:hypothetical protein
VEEGVLDRSSFVSVVSPNQAQALHAKVYKMLPANHRESNAR